MVRSPGIGSRGPTDTDDLDFGAMPNLFSIASGTATHDVVGVGARTAPTTSSTVTARTRDGRAWDDADPSALPYWRTNLVPGQGRRHHRNAGGRRTCAADLLQHGAGTGDDIFNPQRPTVHALDADTGRIVWQNTTEPNADASFAPTSAIPGVVFVGKDVGGALRAYDAATGAMLASFPVGLTLASAPAVVDGTIIVGAGSGERGSDPTDPAAIEAALPVDITAFCVAGTRGCRAQGAAVR